MCSFACSTAFSQERLSSSADKGTENCLDFPQMYQYQQRQAKKYPRKYRQTGKKKSSDQLFILHSQVIDLRWGHYSLLNTFFPENLKSIPFLSSHTSGHQCGFDTGSSLRPLYNFPFGERKACQMLGKAA